MGRQPHQEKVKPSGEHPLQLGSAQKGAKSCAEEMRADPREKIFCQRPMGCSLSLCVPDVHFYSDSEWNLCLTCHQLFMSRLTLMRGRAI